MPLTERGNTMVRGMRWPLLTLCTAAALCPPAQAQVVRCTDARTGAVVYTDGGCASGTAAREVEPRKTGKRSARSASRRPRPWSANSNAWTPRPRPPASRPNAMRCAHGPHRPTPVRPHPGCVRSRRLVQEAADAQAREPWCTTRAWRLPSARWTWTAWAPRAAELEKARAQRPQVVVVPLGRPVHTAPPQRPKLTHCTDFTCFDTQGKAYPRAGPGRLPGPDGTCRLGGWQGTLLIRSAALRHRG